MALAWYVIEFEMTPRAPNTQIYLYFILIFSLEKYLNLIILI